MSFGLTDYIAEAAGISPDTQQRIAQQNPILSAASEIGGAVLPSLIPVVGQATAGGLIARAGARVGSGVAKGIAGIPYRSLAGAAGPLTRSADTIARVTGPLSKAAGFTARTGLEGALFSGYSAALQANLYRDKMGLGKAIEHVAEETAQGVVPGVGFSLAFMLPGFAGKYLKRLGKRFGPVYVPGKAGVSGLEITADDFLQYAVTPHGFDELSRAAGGADKVVHHLEKLGFKLTEVAKDEFERAAAQKLPGALADRATQRVKLNKGAKPKRVPTESEYRAHQKAKNDFLDDKAIAREELMDDWRVKMTEHRAKARAQRKIIKKSGNAKALDDFEKKTAEDLQKLRIQRSIAHQKFNNDWKKLEADRLYSVEKPSYWNRFEDPVMQYSTKDEWLKGRDLRRRQLFSDELRLQRRIEKRFAGKGEARLKRAKDSYNKGKAKRDADWWGKEKAIESQWDDLAKKATDAGAGPGASKYYLWKAPANPKYGTWDQVVFTGKGESGIHRQYMTPAEAAADPVRAMAVKKEVSHLQNVIKVGDREAMKNYYGTNPTELGKVFDDLAPHEVEQLLKRFPEHKLQAFYKPGGRVSWEQRTYAVKELAKYHASMNQGFLGSIFTRIIAARAAISVAQGAGALGGAATAGPVGGAMGYLMMKPLMNAFVKMAPDVQVALGNATRPLKHYLGRNSATKKAFHDSFRASVLGQWMDDRDIEGIRKAFKENDPQWMMQQIDQAIPQGMNEEDAQVIRQAFHAGYLKIGEALESIPEQKPEDGPPRKIPLKDKVRLSLVLRAVSQPESLWWDIANDDVREETRAVFEAMFPELYKEAMKKLKQSAEAGAIQSKWVSHAQAKRGKRLRGEPMYSTKMFSALHEPDKEEGRPSAAFRTNPMSRQMQTPLQRIG